MFMGIFRRSMGVSERVSRDQTIPLSEVHVGQRAESVRPQRSTRDLDAGRMVEVILGAAVMVYGTMG